MVIPQLRLVSRRKNEWAGPCPFGQGGHDRWHYWPDKGNWWCRHNCADCPGRPCDGPGGGRSGWLDDDKPKLPKPKPTPPLTMDRVRLYARALDGEVLGYFRTRGVTAKTVRRFWIGRCGPRFTIPNFRYRNGAYECLGIKKRWIGTPPADYIPRYIVEPGSSNAELFNLRRLAKPRPYVLIVESLMDVILLDQLGIPAVCPFGGGDVWVRGWARHFERVSQIIHVADNDEAGLGYAQRRRELLGRGEIVLPPGGHVDLGEAHQRGENIPRWLQRHVLTQPH